MELVNLTNFFKAKKHNIIESVLNVHQESFYKPSMTNTGKWPQTKGHVTFFADLNLIYKRLPLRYLHNIRMYHIHLSEFHRTDQYLIVDSLSKRRSQPHKQNILQMYLIYSWSIFYQIAELCKHIICVTILI